MSVSKWEQAASIAEMRNRPVDNALVIMVSRHTWDTCLDVADAYLAEHPADEHESATLAWLDRLDGTPGTSPAGYRYVDFTIDRQPDCHVFVRLHDPGQDSEGQCLAGLYSLTFDAGRTVSETGVGLVGSWPRTRGEARRLLDSLGAAFKKGV